MLSVYGLLCAVHGLRAQTPNLPQAWTYYFAGCRFEMQGLAFAGLCHALVVWLADLIRNHPEIDREPLA